MHVFMPTSDHLVITLLFFLSSLIHNVWSLGIDFTVPAGGATLPAGPITITWGDAGGSPDMAQLTSFKLDVMVGGNSQDDSEIIQTIDSNGALISSGQIMGNIPASAAQSIQNGFYLRMTSQTVDNDEVVNYSNRFTLINMNGTTDSQYLEGANAAAGSVSNVPEAQLNMIVAPSSSTTLGSGTSTTTHHAPTSTTIGSSHTSKNGDSLSGLTLGLIIMGSILALIGVISIIVWILFFLRKIRRKREGAKEPKDTPEDPFALGSKTELGAYRSSRVVSTSRAPIEMDAVGNIKELSATDTPAEVPGSPLIYELEGDISAWEAGSGRRSKAWEAV